MNDICLLYTSDGTAQQIADTLNYVKQYLDIMLLGLPPFMMVQIYSSTLRAVSYTHLDVYKRQHICDTGQRHFHCIYLSL